MTKQQFLSYCFNTYGTLLDYPFDEDFETAVLRHADNRKWYALVVRLSRRKFGLDSDEVIDVVNLYLLWTDLYYMARLIRPLFKVLKTKILNCEVIFGI